MKEQVLLLGEKRSLVGIITNPDPYPAPNTDDNPAVILLNAGLMHRVGPNRIYVKIARKLASDGFPVLRFDFSGIGDSKVRRDNLPFKKSAICEVQEAMDILASSRGVKRFILIGLCSGADNAFRAACSDSRVAGAVMIDYDHVPSMGFYLQSYRRRLLSYRSWWSLITGKSDLWGILRGIQWSDIKHLLSRLTSPPKKKLQEPPEEQKNAGLHSLVKRGVDLYFIFTAGGEGYYNYCLNLKDEIQSLDSKKLQVKVFSDTDHTFTLLSNQVLLVNEISDWVQKSMQSEE